MQLFEVHYDKAFETFDEMIAKNYIPNVIQSQV